MTFVSGKFNESPAGFEPFEREPDQVGERGHGQLVPQDLSRVLL